MHLTQAAPAAAAISAEEVRGHLRTPSTDDPYLETLIAVATSWVEAWTRRALIQRAVVYKLDAFPCAREIALPLAPLVSVSSVTYRDTESTTKTLSGSTDYEVDTGSAPGRVLLRYSATWPLALAQPLAVTVSYLAGYGINAAAVPEALKHAIKLLAGHLYENREASSPLEVRTVPMGVEYLVAPFRVWTEFE